MAGQTETFAEHRDDILARAEAAGWPPIVVAGLGIAETSAAWRALVEIATGHELILLTRELMELDDLDTAAPEQES